MDSFKDKVAVVTGAAIVNISSSRDRMTHQMIYHGDNGWKLEI